MLAGTWQAPHAAAQRDAVFLLSALLSSGSSAGQPRCSHNGGAQRRAGSSSCGGCANSARLAAPQELPLLVARRAATGKQKVGEARGVVGGGGNSADRRGDSDGALLAHAWRRRCNRRGYNVHCSARAAHRCTRRAARRRREALRRSARRHCHALRHDAATAPCRLRGYGRRKRRRHAPRRYKQHQMTARGCGARTGVCPATRGRQRRLALGTKSVARRRYSTHDARRAG